MLSEDERLRLEECVREPIRAPGAIQPHGALLAVAPDTLEIMYASDNCAVVLGIDARLLLGRPLSAVTGESWAQEHVDPNVETATDGNPRALELGAKRFEVIVHHDGPFSIVEFEPVDSDYGDRMAVAVYGAMHRLARLRTQGGLWQATARELCKLTLFERVTIYSFHPDGHGEIVAEELEEGMEPYLGLHFPASDIPEQARQLYLTKLSRLIVDNSGATSELLTLAPADGSEPAPLDLSAAELRSVSPHHLQFMRNMGQASTLSLSLVRDGRLIGMITLAQSTTHKVPYALRQGLEVLANQVALQLQSMDEIDRLTAQVHVRSIRAQLVDQSGVTESTNTSDIAAALFEGNLTVLNLVPASGAVLSLADSITTIGDVPPLEAIGYLDRWAKSNVVGKSYSTERLPAAHPDLAERLVGVTGLLYVPLPGTGDFIAWFRPEITDDVRWLGDQTPGNRVTTLSPRTSFSAWTESVTGKSEPWNGLEREAEELSRDLAGAMVRLAEAKLAALAMSDALTGLPNRRMLMDRLSKALSIPLESGETTVLFIDLDSFKQINDTHGHDFGDQVLLHASQRILESTRAGDTVARLGGDEFVVLCETTNREEAGVIAGRIIEAIRDPIVVNGVALSVTASVGIAGASIASSAEELLRGADVAMYRAKSMGRDQVAR
ncbi:diguanylate cyclase domain-containing protein [Conyzicola sp.]|uniref:sensor domain-containing diguanylate cyclase n=1 Tax=Conyzicola sp. TaxID=1969404 RepID=UPI003989B0AB